MSKVMVYSNNVISLELELGDEGSGEVEALGWGLELLLQDVQYYFLQVSFGW